MERFAWGEGRSLTGFEVFWGRRILCVRRITSSQHASLVHLIYFFDEIRVPTASLFFTFYHVTCDALHAVIVLNSTAVSKFVVIKKAMLYSTANNEKTFLLQCSTRHFYVLDLSKFLNVNHKQLCSTHNKM